MNHHKANPLQPLSNCDWNLNSTTLSTWSCSASKKSVLFIPFKAIVFLVMQINSFFDLFLEFWNRDHKFLSILIALVFSLVFIPFKAIVFLVMQINSFFDLFLEFRNYDHKFLSILIALVFSWFSIGYHGPLDLKGI